MGLLGCGNSAGADRPDWLVGNHQRSERLGIDQREPAIKLVRQHSLGLIVGALLLCFANAKNCGEASFARGEQFLGQHGVCLVEVLAAFRVAEDDAVNVNLVQHRSADLTSERALRRLVHVLRVNLNA